jgi:hypothetical protein
MVENMDRPDALIGLRTVACSKKGQTISRWLPFVLAFSDIDTAS